MSSEGITISYGTAISLRPFFATHATENDKTTDSITEFFMDSCDCPKTSNGYYHWNCASMKCKNCKKIKPMPLKCKTLQTKIKVSQFEVTKKVYKKTDKNGKSHQKTSEN